MKWQNIIELAREMAATEPSDHFHQTRLRMAVGNAYYAMYHALARSNADLLIGPSETEGSSPGWNRVYTALGGDSAFELIQADFSRQPARGDEAYRRRLSRRPSPAAAGRGGSGDDLHG